MNAKEAARRQKLIQSTLGGLEEILTTNLQQDRDQEQLLKELLTLGQVWMEAISDQT